MGEVDRRRQATCRRAPLSCSFTRLFPSIVQLAAGSCPNAVDTHVRPDKAAEWAHRRDERCTDVHKINVGDKGLSGTPARQATQQRARRRVARCAALRAHASPRCLSDNLTQTSTPERQQRIQKCTTDATVKHATPFQICTVQIGTTHRA